jgi:hypothetical protein
VWGKDWEQMAPNELIYMWQNINRPVAGGERVVIMSRVLADDFNQGYQHLRNLVLKKVNGQEVHSLSELETLLTKSPVSRNGKPYAVFGFDFGAGDVILAANNLEKVNERLAKTYGVPRDERLFK